MAIEIIDNVAVVQIGDADITSSVYTSAVDDPKAAAVVAIHMFLDPGGVLGDHGLSLEDAVEQLGTSAVISFRTKYDLIRFRNHLNKIIATVENGEEEIRECSFCRRNFLSDDIIYVASQGHIHKSCLRKGMVAQCDGNTPIVYTYKSNGRIRQSRSDIDTK